MNKTLMILLIMITVAKGAFAADLPDGSNDDTLLEKASEINAIQDDLQKIKEWAKINSSGNYVIVNKKDCSAVVCEKDGNEIKKFEVGIGRDIGDDLNDTAGALGKPRNTTPPGEYTLNTNVVNKANYGDFTLSLGQKPSKVKNPKKVIAMHKVPKFRLEERKKKFYDGNLANNRMSHGCINFTEKDFKEFVQYIQGGLKAYVLPEEEDNQLILAKNSKAQFEFSQTKYKKAY